MGAHRARERAHAAGRRPRAAKGRIRIGAVVVAAVAAPVVGAGVVSLSRAVYAVAPPDELAIHAGTGGNLSPPVDGRPATGSDTPSPTAVATGRDGTVFVGFAWGAVYEIDRSGVMHLFAGDPGNGTSGEPAARAAPLGSPVAGLATSANGDLYVADAGRYRVLKVSADGSRTVVAGNGSPGRASAAGDATTVPVEPRGLAVGPDGALYIASTAQNVVFKLDASGLGVFAGDGSTAAGDDGSPAAGRPVGSPAGVAADTRGNVYITDTGHSYVYRVGADGKLRVLAGDGTNEPAEPGPASLSPVGAPTGIAADPRGSVFVSASSGREIVRIDPDGGLALVSGGEDAGVPKPGDAASAAYTEVRGVAVDAVGHLFAADYGSHYVTRTTRNIAADPPTDLTAVPAADGAQLTFAAPTFTGNLEIEGYEYSVDNGQHWAELTGAARANPVTATITGLARAAQTVVVRAVNTAGKSAASAPVTFTPTGTSPLAAPARTAPLPAATTGEPAPRSTARPAAPALKPIDREGWAGVPEHPEQVTGKELRTWAYLASARGADAHLSTKLGKRVLTRGQATTLLTGGIFVYNRAALNARGQAAVRNLATHLPPGAGVTCEGYTDYDGSPVWGRTLSTGRARAVCAALKKYGSGVTAGAVGYGPKRPAVIGGSSAGRSENRRVVIVVNR
ncbi:hypothetical protein [Actinoplanes sp. NBRC 101535]|uniref:hypothetical protein n=1 Tax=Actinoplanes sp. NBRC 101535 TaxID=3032196 RepID=UPI0025553766|nr:hypothetical protein [Actinoplanes sp. NBRC 101535]